MKDSNIILLNSGKTDAYAHLLRFAKRDDLHVITERKYESMYPDTAPLVFVNDIADTSEVMSVARQLNAERLITSVVAPSERSLPVGGYLRSYFGIEGPSFDVSWRFSNKFVMKRRLADRHVPTARFSVVPDFPHVPEAAESVGWPIVVKPVIGSGSMNTFVINDIEEFNNLSHSALSDGIRKTRYEVIVEEFIRMTDEYHFDAIVHDGKIQFCVLQRYFNPLLGRTGKWSGSVLIKPDDSRFLQAEPIYESTIKALGLKDGVTHLELFQKESGQFIVGEVSCRPAGGGIPKSILLKYGIDIWDAFIASQLNLAYPVHPKEQFTGSIANIDLPVEEGVIRKIVSASELSHLPGYLTSDLCDVGTVFPHPLNSSSATGIVFTRIDNESDVDKKIKELAKAFHVEYENLNGK